MTTPEPSRSTESDARHEPVLVAEVVALLAPRADGSYVDATLGFGGHAAALLAAGAGRVIGIDRDPAALAAAQARLGARVEAVHANHRDLPRVLADRGLTSVDGIVADLGVSSMQIDEPDRGFSFRAAGPLDMRMDPTRGDTLAGKLAAVDEKTLADVIFEFGEERHSRRVAKAIVRARDRGALTDTAALASVVRGAAGGGRGWQRIDPATRTFQALRIWVNEELDGLEAFLRSAFDALAPGGRLAVIAFHSLEDRMVKHTLREIAALGRGTVLTRRPQLPGDDEIARNPRARSARLRAIAKVEPA
jgi:16S rRNA (cytosine1402-N4)-methyltransferase